MMNLIPKLGISCFLMIFWFSSTPVLSANDNARIYSKHEIAEIQEKLVQQIEMGIFTETSSGEESFAGNSKVSALQTAGCVDFSWGPTYGTRSCPDNFHVSGFQWCDGWFDAATCKLVCCPN